MTRKVNLHDARTHLSELVEQAASGDEIIIAKGGRAKARLGPLPAPKQRRRPGLLRGKLWIAPDFDEPLPPHLLGKLARTG